MGPLDDGLQQSEDGGGRKEVAREEGEVKRVFACLVRDPRLDRGKQRCYYN